MSWKQNLVNAQVEVNRSVFEMNKPGMWPPEESNIPYIVLHIGEAIKDLTLAFENLKKSAP
jgi:hypothetical protein